MDSRGSCAPARRPPRKFSPVLPLFPSHPPGGPHGGYHSHYHDEGYGPPPPHYEGRRMGPPVGGHRRGPSRYGPQYGHPPPPPPPPEYGPHADSPVLMVYGLDQSKMNCDRVFNVFCLYGNVEKVSLCQVRCFPYRPSWLNLRRPGGGRSLAGSRLMQRGWLAEAGGQLQTFGLSSPSELCFLTGGVNQDFFVWKY